METLRPIMCGVHVDGYYDDSGIAKYLWCYDTESDNKAIYIWAEEYYLAEKCVSDQGSDYLRDVETKEDTLKVHDATFDVIRREMNDLGFCEDMESWWAASGYTFTTDLGPIDKLIEYVQNHPRFKHCPDMEA